MVDIDIDIWRYGRDPHGRLNVKYLKAGGYPYIKLDNTKMQEKMSLIIYDNLQPGQNGLREYVIIGGYAFFYSKDDRDLCQGLLYIY